MNLRSFLVQNIATIHTMTRVRIKDLLIAKNYASAAILSNQSKRTSSMYLLSPGFPSILNRTKISCEESVSIQVSDFGEKV